MQDIEIVEHAIKKARGNGWDEFRSQYDRAFKQHGRIMVEFLIGLEEPPLIVALESVLFSSSFAENIFGTDTYYFVTFRDHSPNKDGSMAGWKSEKEIAQLPEVVWEYYDDVPAYEYHLQQLVLIDSQSERIAYLGKHL